jgi:hypothetical protein
MLLAYNVGCVMSRVRSVYRVTVCVHGFCAAGGFCMYLECVVHVFECAWAVDVGVECRDHALGMCKLYGACMLWV